MSDVVERPPSVRRYIFFNEHRPSRAWMPTLEIINDRFCQYLRSALLHLLPSPVEVTPPIAIQLVKHGEMAERFEVPSYLTIAELSPLRGAILIVIDAQLVNWIVESRFGGNGRFPVTTANREFTPFEQKCMRRVADTTLEQFTRAWKPIAIFSPHILRHEINAHFAGIATADELIILNTSDVKVGPGGGRLTICIPYAMLEPLHDHLVTGTVKRAVDHDLRWREALTTGVGQTALTLNVELAKIEITVADLLELRPGMVFEIERPESVTVEAGGLPLFRARWGRVGRRIGVRIEERLLPCAPAVIPGHIVGEKRP
jgi:flagellar motor switch protein FliM